LRPTIIAEPYPGHSLIAGGVMHQSGEVEAGSDHPRLAADEVDRLIFRKRVASERSSQSTPSSRLMWMVLALVGSVVFVLLVRALLDRTSDTAGLSAESPTASEAFSPGRSAAVTMPPPQAASRTPTSSRTSTQLHMVYRCVRKGGAFSLQSQPCAPDQRVTREIYAPPEVERARRPTIVSSAPTRTSSYSNGPSAIDYERSVEPLATVRSPLVRTHSRLLGWRGRMSCCSGWMRRFTRLATGSRANNPGPAG
jgi:hypothetical protein